MPKAKVIQSSFTTGVIAPTLAGRIDIAKYYNALVKGENITLMPHGGCERRAGTRPVLKSTDSSLGYAQQEFFFTAQVRIQPFVFNIDQKYLIVLDVDKIHVVKDLLLIATLNTASAAATPFSSAYSSAFGSNTHPFTREELEQMDITQYGDTMIMVHENFAPKKLVRGVTETDWTLEDIVFENIPLYDYVNQYLGKRELFKGDGTEKEFVLLYTKPQFTVYLDEVKQPTTAYVYDREVGKITFTTAPANGVKVELISGAGVPSMGADNTYENIWSDARGYPKTVTIFQGRLYFGGTKSKPITVLGSVINSYFDFNLGDGEADMGIFDTISSGTFDDIAVITSARTLQVLTESGEYYNPASPVTPATSSWKRQTGYGAARTDTVNIDGATYFVDASKAAIRQFIYSLEEDAYVSPNISLLSDHLISDVKRIAVSRGAGSNIANLVYALNRDGSMAVLNTMRLEDIQGWSRWTTQGRYTDVCTVDDDVYLLVARGYEEGTEYEKYYIEKVDTGVLLDHYHSQGDWIDEFLGDDITRLFELKASTDGAFKVLVNDVEVVPQPTYDAVDNTIKFAIAPNEDEKILVIPTAQVYSDMVLPTSAALGYRELAKKGNFYYEGLDVPFKDGLQLKMKFESYHSFLEAGFNFPVKIRTVNLNTDSQEGAIANVSKRLTRVKVTVHETMGIKIQNYRIADRSFVMDFSNQLKPFTGIKEARLLGYANHNSIEITQDIPMPFTLLQIETEIKY